VAKKFLTSISICYVQEKNPFSFFSQICLFQTFYSHIYPQNVQFFYMPIQIEFKQKYFNCLLLLRFQISLLPKIFPIKKTAAFCVFCGLRYSSDNLLSFDTNALYFVRPLYIDCSQTHECGNGTEAKQFLFWEDINPNFMQFTIL
jgi:hypothetical protein